MTDVIDFEIVREEKLQGQRMVCLLLEIDENLTTALKDAAAYQDINHETLRELRERLYAIEEAVYDFNWQLYGFEDWKEISLAEDDLHGATHGAIDDDDMDMLVKAVEEARKRGVSEKRIGKIMVDMIIRHKHLKKSLIKNTESS